MAPNTGESSIQISGERSWDSKKFWDIILPMIGIFSQYVAAHSNEQHGIMVAFYVTVVLYGATRAVEIMTKEPYVLTIIEWFQPLIGCLAIVLLLTVLDAVMSIIFSILLALFAVRAFIKTYSEIGQLLLKLSGFALTLPQNAWFCLYNNVPLLRQVSPQADQSPEANGGNDAAPVKVLALQQHALLWSGNPTASNSREDDGNDDSPV